MFKKLFLFFLIVGGLSALVLYVIAKSGVAEVPLMSNAFYTSPEPDHVVEAGSSVEEEMETQLIAALQEKLSAGGISDAEVSLIFNESTLTASLRQAIAAGAEDVLLTDRAQVAVLADGSVELYLPLVRNDGATALVLAAVPYAEEGGIGFDIARVQLGQIALPAWLHGLVQAPLDRLVIQLNDFLADYASLSSITVSEGNVYLTGTMTLDLNTLLE